MLCALRVYGLTHPHLNLITLSFFHSSPLFFTRPCLVLLWKTSWRPKPSDSLHLSYRGFYLLLPNPCFKTKARQRKVSSGKKIKTQPDHVRNFMKPVSKRLWSLKESFLMFCCVSLLCSLRHASRVVLLIFCLVSVSTRGFLPNGCFSIMFIWIFLGLISILLADVQINATGNTAFIIIVRKSIFVFLPWFVLRTYLLAVKSTELEIRSHWSVINKWFDLGVHLECPLIFIR